MDVTLKRVERRAVVMGFEVVVMKRERGRGEIGGKGGDWG